MRSANINETFVEYAARKLEDHFGQVRRCCELLSEEQIWFRANTHSNSVANLLLHLNGNVGQWILGGVGGQAVTRERQAEFDARQREQGIRRGGNREQEELVRRLDETVRGACAIIRGTDGRSLMEETTIQNYHVTRLAAIMHVVEHFAFHTGQIVTTTKWLLDVDLSIYDEEGHRRDGRATEVP